MTKKLPKAVKPEEFKSLISHTKKVTKHKSSKDQRMMVAFLLAYGAGLRVSEITGRKNERTKCCDALIKKKFVRTKSGNRITKYLCADCDTEVYEETVYRSTKKNDWSIKPLNKEQINKKHIEIWDAKGGKDRIVPLPKGWRDWMMKYIPIGKTDRTLERKFKIYSKRAGLPAHYVFHSLRHGFATRLVENRVPINHIQTLLGHSDISTTGVYLRARPQDALKSYEELF